MTALAFLLAVGALIVAFIAQREAVQMRDRVEGLHALIQSLLRRLADLERAGIKPPPQRKPEQSEPALKAEAAFSAAPAPAITVPPPLPPVLPKTEAVVPLEAPLAEPNEPPPLPEPAFARAAEAPPAAPAPTLPHFDWEQFLGVKGLAWIAGFALFLGVVFFLKFSFDKGWVTPTMRTVMGFVTGTGLLVGGAWLQRKKLSIPAQALCASGTVILYATSFVASSKMFYHLIPPGVAFAVMSVVTVAAFALAVRFDARVIAILGLFGGFLTPILASTGEDNPLGLFGYIALLDAGLLAVALRQRWNFLAALGAVGTVFMQMAWLDKFFQPGLYFEGGKILIPFAVFLGFSGLFLAGLVLAKRRQLGDAWFLIPAILLPVVALGVTFYFLGFPALAGRPALVFSYVLLADACLMALAWIHRPGDAVPALGGALVFALLAMWTGGSATLELLNTGLALYFLFGAVHALQPLVFQRFRPESKVPWWSNAWALVALGLMLLPILKLTPDGLGIWIFVLLLDLLVIGLAIVSGFVLWVVAALVLTLVSAGAWIVSAPAEVGHVTGDLLVIGLFAGVFIAAGVFLSRKLAGRTPANLPFPTSTTDVWSNELLLPRVPAFAAVMPFALLVLMALRLPLANPSPLFGLGLLLMVFLLGLARYFRLSIMPGIGLAAMLALEHAWYFARFETPMAPTALGWFAGFALVFTLYPFLFWREFKEEVVPWAAAALAGPLHFYLVHNLVQRAWPNDFMGLLPAIFALPALAGLFFLIKHLSTEDGRRNTQLALFGGAALFFVTLIFPIQFSKQWLTLSWALEGVALLWLFHRVPHPGLRLTALALLLTSFLRLMNPFVLGYHPRSDTPILNWYLYTYGVAALCCFVAAHLLAPPRDRVFNFRVPPLLVTLGTILAFVLVNLEIADYFTAAGATRLEFEFGGNFLRDMTYTIAWAIFALVLVIAGLVRRLGACRWAGMGLLLVTLAKLFLHDLAKLDALYRVGAFITVAVIAFAASFLYQRFFAITKLAQTAAATEEKP
jgi:uncharacterized membrane protein